MRHDDDVPHWLLNGDDPEVRESFKERLTDETMEAYFRERGRQTARQLVRREQGPSLDHEPVSLAEAMRQQADPVTWVVDGLHAYGDSTMIAATNKAGKTTLALNLVAALLDGEALLGEWPTKYPDHASILYLNYELGVDRFKTWASEIGMTHPDRLMVWNLRGKQFPLDNDDVQAAVARQARLRAAELIIVDPFQRAFTGDNENDATQVNRFLGALDVLKDKAGIPNLLVLDHAGHTEKSRARGSSAKGGWPDSTWSLIKDGESPRAPRYLSAYGRDVDVSPPLRLVYDDATHRLSLASDQPGQVAAQPVASLAQQGLIAVARFIAAEDEARGSAKLRTYFRDVRGGERDKARDAAIGRMSRLSLNLGE